MHFNFGICILIILILAFLHAIQGNMECGRVNLEQFHNATNDVAANEYSWMARVGFNFDGKINFVGLAVLISHRYLLGAGFNSIHLRHPAEQVIFGETNTSESVRRHYCSMLFPNNCAQSPVIYSIESVILHPNFNMDHRSEDIALLELQQNVNHNDYINPICLPPNMPFEDYFAGQFLPYVGFSHTKSLVEYKRKTLLHVMSAKYCQTKLNEYDFIMNDKEICGMPQAPVLMKTGSALIGVRLEQGLPKQFYLIGIVMQGATKSTTGVPDILTRVSAHIAWIETVLESKVLIDVRRNLV